jgi:hypothetical protein
LNQLNLSDAITEVEGAQSAYTNAAAVVTNDQGAVTAAQAKLDAANAQVATDQTAATAAVTAFNSALSDLIAAAQAAMISVPGPQQPTPTPVAS